MPKVNVDQYLIKMYGSLRCKGGGLEILHPYDVYTRFTLSGIYGDPEEYRDAILLHDILEDFDVTAQELIDMGLSFDSVYIINELTRGDTEVYRDYIDRLARHRYYIIPRIKYCDAWSNYERTSLIEDVKSRESLRKRYRYVMETLTSMDLDHDEEEIEDEEE